MLVLLSSSKRKRYRDDILRSLAAPRGTEVQFRYSKEIVEKRIWEAPESYQGKEGVVCSVDLDMVGNPCKLIPVRTVVVRGIFRHGSTMTLVLTVRDLALTENVDEFTSEVNIKSGGQVPVNLAIRDDAVGSSGRFFFDVEGGIGNFIRQTSLANWERITETLFAQQKGYSEVPFFWTVLGLYAGASQEPRSGKDDFIDWNENADPNKDCSLLVYVFHPLKDRWKPQLSQLRLTSSFNLSTSYPLDATVDSSYDLKRWRFQIEAPDFGLNRRGWIRIGPLTSAEAFGTGNQITRQNPIQVSQSLMRDWEIDLPLKIRFSWLKFVSGTSAIGLLLAGPAVTSIWLQGTLSVPAKISGTAVSLILGLAASAVARFGIKKAL